MEYVILLGIILGVYFLPTFIAVARGKRNVIPIFIVNLLFGWSLIGWIIAFIWAFTYDVPVAADR